jgi:hypothetical protein
MIFPALLVALAALGDEAPAAAAPAEPTPVVEPVVGPSPVPSEVEVAPAPVPPPVEEKKVEEKKPEERKPGYGTTLGVDGLALDLLASVRLSQTLGNPIAVDDVGTSVQPMPFETRLRLAPQITYKGFGLISEFDLSAGAILGIPDSTVVADRVPTPALQPAVLRQFYAQYRWGTGVVRLGQQTSQFGLGMLANSGSKDAEPGDFGMQHFGTLALRALIAGRPLFGLGGSWRAVEPFAAFDLVVRDATADLLAGDRALQGIVGVRFNVDDSKVLALTLIYRNQRRDNGSPGERSTDAFVGDLSGKWTLFDDANGSLNVGAEIAGITGTTTQGRSDTAPVLDLRQLGAVAKVKFTKGHFSLLFDGGYASGDQNPYDAQLNNFRFDRDYKVGLVLFDQVLGYQSARSGLRAADPLLTGVAPEGVDLLPTGGAITGAWYLFPRARYGFTDWLDLYGGPLFAFTSAKLTDPFNTRLNGGTPLNFLGGVPGNYLGTELDLGLSGHFLPTKYLPISVTLEGGVLLPGDALNTVSGKPMGASGLGRLRLTVGL